jgi:homoserine O-acetyltransferase
MLGVNPLGKQIKSARKTSNQSVGIREQGSVLEKNNGVGLVKTDYFHFALPPNELILENGERLGPITIAYETYGKLNQQRSNAVLILHALSGDAHAAGFHKGDEKPGWWDDMIGPDRAFDTNKYFIICSNVLGGCTGTTGPSSVNAKTGKPYGPDFPIISISDMVNVQKHLIDHLEIDRLLSVAGGSMGGMQVLEWLTAHPERLTSAIVIATATKHSAQQIAFHEVGRQAIMADPLWKDGHYYGGHSPAKGLAVARMIGHITYMSEVSMAEKFGRRPGEEKLHKFSVGSEVEDYLYNRGNHFVKRFDANSYLYITRAIDSFDASKGKNLHEVFKETKAKVLVLAFKSDWLYPASQSKEILKACKWAGIDTTYCEIDSTYGHDAFLLEVEEETHLVKHFLQKVILENGVTSENRITEYAI